MYHLLILPKSPYLISCTSWDAEGKEKGEEEDESG